MKLKEPGKTDSLAEMRETDQFAKVEYYSLTKVTWLDWGKSALERKYCFKQSRVFWFGEWHIHFA